MTTKKVIKTLSSPEPFIYEFDEIGKVVSIQIDGKKVSIGSHVVSNGLYGPPAGVIAGVKGMVTNLWVIGVETLTSDVIQVAFEDCSYAKDLKFDDLDFDKIHAAAHA